MDPFEDYLGGGGGGFHHGSSSHQPFRQHSKAQEGWGILGGDATQYGLAFCLICLIQFRATYTSWIRAVYHRYRGLGPSEILWDLWECSYAYLQALLDTIRVVVSQGGLLEANDALPLERTAPNSPVNARRAMAISASLPDLEEVHVRSTSGGGVSRMSLSIGNKHEELEPAFLRDEDYPEGWMVYHPVLGVVLKKEADKYEKERRQQREEESTTNAAIESPVDRETEESSTEATATVPSTNTDGKEESHHDQIQ